MDGLRARLSGTRDLGEGAIRQLNDEEINWKASAGDNSAYNIIRHLHGNMLSRFTDFLESDGEKPWRDRDGEFEDATGTQQSALALWDAGWGCLEKALAPLGDSDLDRTITIRGERHTVFDAVVRQVSHYAYHVGQIVYIAKMLKGQGWKSLSIPKGTSGAFTREMQQRFSQTPEPDSEPKTHADDK